LLRAKVIDLKRDLKINSCKIAISVPRFTRCLTKYAPEYLIVRKFGNFLQRSLVDKLPCRTQTIEVGFITTDCVSGSPLEHSMTISHVTKIGHAYGRATARNDDREALNSTNIRHCHRPYAVRHSSTSNYSMLLAPQKPSKMLVAFDFQSFQHLTNTDCHRVK
jgi:hypothetical protein